MIIFAKCTNIKSFCYISEINMLYVNYSSIKKINVRMTVLMKKNPTMVCFQEKTSWMCPECCHPWVMAEGQRGRFYWWSGCRRLSFWGSCPGDTLASGRGESKLTEPQVTRRGIGLKATRTCWKGTHVFLHRTPGASLPHSSPPHVLFGVWWPQRSRVLILSSRGKGP